MKHSILTRDTFTQNLKALVIYIQQKLILNNSKLILVYKSRPTITPELQPGIFQYIGGIAQENKIKLLSVGGVDRPHSLLDFDVFDNLRYEKITVVKRRLFKMNSRNIFRTPIV